LSIEKELLGFYVTGHPLDEFEEIIASIDCETLSMVEEMPDRKVFKAAFIVDTLQVRISQRTQKKFAIMTISNGIERFELPVWPDIFNEKASLLDDNALLIGVLQVDRRDEGLKIGCKALASLTGFNDEARREIDAAFESALRMSMTEPKGGKKKSMKIQPVEPQKNVTMRVDLNKISMSEILRLKEILVTHGGKDTFHLVFLNEGKGVGRVEVESTLGVNYSEELKKELETLVSAVDLICK